MLRKLIGNDIRRHGFLSAVTTLFMALCAMLLALTILLFLNLSGAIDSLMERAQTPDFLQMHAGEIDREALRRFAESRQDVEQWQVCGFLNLENGIIRLGEKTLEDSTQDNGLCVQGRGFDYLLDLENCLPDVKEGQIYVPVCYRAEYGVREGDVVRIGTREFVIAGFIRDSQMNSMMASSKRFLVSEADYRSMSAIGSEEYLIEFLLRGGADMNAFQTAYTAAGLPANGPTITRPLIRLMNALSDGMMILVILLVSVVVLLISLLCIRYILLTRMEEDRQEIGMLKAIGISGKDIHLLYFSKYLVMSAAGAVLGLLAAACLYRPLNRQMRELYGTADAGVRIAAGTVLGVLFIEGLLLLAISRLLKRMRRITALAALREGTVRAGQGGGRRCLPIALVVAAGVFLMVVPGNLYSTISSPQFVTYMGIGDGEVRLDVRQTENIAGMTEQLEELLGGDSRVEKSTALVTKSFRFLAEDGSSNLTVELGDHSVFPVTYSRGEAPLGDRELALSALQAEELGLDVGDQMTLMIDDRSEIFIVCGIYSDITNGGRTAKAAFCDTSGAAMWSVFYVKLAEDTGRGDWIAEYQERCAAEGITVKISDIAEYVQGTYGQTLSQVELAARAALGVAAAVIAIVTFLFLRLSIEQDRSGIALRKALGFTNREAGECYLRRALIAALFGLLAGILAGNICGEGVCGMLLRSFGADSFRFVTDRVRLLFTVPAVSMGAAVAAVERIKKIYAYECAGCGKAG